jgi:hypothetical protein
LEYRSPLIQSQGVSGINTQDDERRRIHHNASMVQNFKKGLKTIQLR